MPKGKWGASLVRVLETIGDDGTRHDVNIAFLKSGQGINTAGAALHKAFALGLVRKSKTKGHWRITAEGREAIPHYKNYDQHTNNKRCEECGRLFGWKKQIGKDGSNKGWYKTLRFCSMDCYGAFISKNATGFVRSDGYQIMRGKRHHRTVMEELLGRQLERHETVHHKNGNRSDNRPENLELWAHNHPPGQRVIDLAFPAYHY